MPFIERYNNRTPIFNNRFRDWDIFTPLWLTHSRDTQFSGDNCLTYRRLSLVHNTIAGPFISNPLRLLFSPNTGPDNAAIIMDDDYSLYYAHNDLRIRKINSSYDITTSPVINPTNYTTNGRGFLVVGDELWVSICGSGAAVSTPRVYRLDRFSLAIKSFNIFSYGSNPVWLKMTRSNNRFYFGLQRNLGGATVGFVALLANGTTQSWQLTGFNVDLLAGWQDAVFVAVGTAIRKYNEAGTLLFTNTLPSNIWGLYVDQGFVYVSCAGGQIYKLDNNLTQIWTKTIGGNAMNIVSDINSDRIWVWADTNTTQYVFDQNGAELSQQNMAGRSMLRMLVKPQFNS